MDSLTYQPTAWEASLQLHTSEEFETGLSSVSHWGMPMDGEWSHLPAIRAMDETHFMSHGGCYEEVRSSKVEDFPLHVSTGGSPRTCSPVELSPLRESFSSPSSSPPSLSSSVSPLASVPSIGLGEFAPNFDHFYAFEAETSRTDIKRNPEAFLHSVFGAANQAHLRDRLRSVIESRWWQESIREPRGLLNVFVKRVGNRLFECQSCKKKLPRADRAIDHFRTHIHHRPFFCTGASDCGDASCRMAFYTRDCLKSHTAKHEKLCERCGTTVEDKNLNRHRSTRKCQRFGLKY